MIVDHIENQTKGQADGRLTQVARRQQHSISSPASGFEEMDCLSVAHLNFGIGIDLHCR
jgi:hypothetical protein